MSTNNYPNKDQAVELINEMTLPVLGGGGGFAPIGTINSYMGTVAPQGWLVCDGTVYNISDYPDLATHIASHFGSTNFFGGNGTTTFGVPDLRGEFLRGSGTNSHANQGSGEDVGEHQDGTEHQNCSNNQTYGTYFPTYPESTNRSFCNLKTDSEIQNTYVGDTSGPYKSRVAGNWNGEGKPGSSFTSRPTNTSVLFIIKATVAGDANAHQYSTEEQVVGKWIDGKDIYERTWTNITVPSGAQDETLLLDLTTLNYETPISIEATTTGAGVVPYVNPHDSNYGFGLRFNPPSQSKKGVIYSSGVDRSWYGKITITLRYTKTS